MDTRVVVNHKSEGITLILSILITGLGHMYVGKVSTGISLLILQVLLAVGCYMGIAAISASGSAAGLLLLMGIGVVMFIVWIYAVLDSYKYCKEYNARLMETGNPPW